MRTNSPQTNSRISAGPDKFPDQCLSGQIPGSVSERTNSPRTNSRISARPDKFPLDNFPGGQIPPGRIPGPGICPGGICPGGICLLAPRLASLLPTTSFCCFNIPKICNANYITLIELCVHHMGMQQLNVCVRQCAWKNQGQYI